MQYARHSFEREEERRLLWSDSPRRGTASPMSLAYDTADCGGEGNRQLEFRQANRQEIVTKRAQAKLPSAR
jgi:hypothetical protein